MASFLKQHTTPIQLAMVVFLTSMATHSLSSPLGKVSTISAAPALLPAEVPISPISFSPQLAPDITPLLPSPKGVAPSPSTGLLPTIPASPSPPNPDEVAGLAPNSADSPSGSFTAMASSSSSTSVAAPLSSFGCSSALYFCLVLICLFHFLGLH